MCAATKCKSMGRERRRRHGMSGHFGSFSTPQAYSRHRSENFGDTYKVVGGCGENEKPLDQRPAGMSRLAQAADSLDPAEWLFDLLTLDRTDAVPGIPGGAGIDRGTAVDIVLGDMR